MWPFEVFHVRSHGIHLDLAMSFFVGFVLLCWLGYLGFSSQQGTTSKAPRGVSEILGVGGFGFGTKGFQLRGAKKTDK